MLYEDTVFEHAGLKFKYRTEPDLDSGPPWKESEGHGPVSEVRYSSTGPKLRPGERLLQLDRGYYLAYDWQAATAAAKADGWGLGKEALLKLEKALGRKPTAGDIREAAVQSDFDFLHGWCNDKWYYVGVIVTLQIEDEHAHLVEDEDFTNSLWCVENGDDNYIEEVVLQLADEIASTVASKYVASKVEAAEALYWAERDVCTVHSEDA